MIDIAKGSVQTLIHGGGASARSNERCFERPRRDLISAAGTPGFTAGRQPPVCVQEDALVSIGAQCRPRLRLGGIQGRSDGRPRRRDHREGHL